MVPLTEVPIVLRNAWFEWRTARLWLLAAVSGKPAFGSAACTPRIRSGRVSQPCVSSAVTSQPAITRSYEPGDDARYAIAVHRGLLFMRQGKLGEAVAELKGAIRLKPHQFQAYADLA